VGRGSCWADEEWAVGGKKGGRRVGRMGRMGMGLLLKSLLKPTFKHFQIKIFRQLFSKLFTNPFTIIFKTFHKYFKTFKTTPQPKSYAYQNDAQTLG
jgi:hypothetical protein